MITSQKNEELIAVSQDSPVTQATPPFDRGNANLTLRTGDHVEFCVHRQILVIASPWFECTLSLSQPPAYRVGQRPDKQVIDVSEDSRTMDIFIRLIYPTPDAEIVDPQLLRNVLGAAIKYESSVVLAAVKRAMVSPRFLQTHFPAVFAITCRNRLEDEAKAAAQQLVEVDSGVQNHDDLILDELTAGQ